MSWGFSQGRSETIWHMKILTISSTALMRMALCWPSLLLLVFGFSTRINAATKSNYTLTPEITNSIPSCAQDCFLSFLDANFPTDTCTTKPTLECLCSSNSTSGYTIGEGAVQCVISEINIGFCKGNSAKDTVVNGAYAMCSGQPSALPNTHATITATLVLQTSMPSIILVAPTPTKLSSSSQSSSITTSTTTKASSSILATITTKPSASSSVSSTTSAVPAASETSSPEPILSKNQIVGITVASIGGGAVAVGLLVLFICCRRRKKKRERESDLIPFQLESSHVMDTKKYKYKSFKGPTERRPGGTRNGVAAKIPPPIPPRLDTSSPNMFSRRSIRPDTIGLAISPEQPLSTEKQIRRSSKLLPEKPTLTLKVPKQAVKPLNGFSFNQPIVQPSAISRQSTATQFEEDYESADTMVATDDTWAAKSTDQILDVGTGTWQTIRKVESQPGQNGAGNGVYHWRPGQNPNNRIANPDYYIRPLSVAGRKIGSFSQPRIPNGYVREQDRQQLSVPEQNRPITASSSLYSNRGSLSSNDQGRNSNTNSRTNRFSYQQAGPYDNQESLVSPQDREQEPRTAGTDYPLSPVVESPASGRSPVSYPKIPPPGTGAGAIATRRLSQSTIRMVPPPPQPDFTKALGAGKPWRQAEIAAQIERERVARGNGQNQGQGQLGMQALRIQGLGLQQQHLRSQNNPTTPSPVTFAFPAPPPQALIPGRSQTTSPPALPSPYMFRSPSQSKLVPPPLLRSRSQLQRETRTPPPSQNQGGFISQQSQLPTVTESPPTKMTPPTGLLRTRSQLQREGRTPSPNPNPNPSQNRSQTPTPKQTRPQQQTQTLRIVTSSPQPQPRPGPNPTQNPYTTQPPHSLTQSSTTLPTTHPNILLPSFPPSFPPQRTSSLASQASSLTNLSINTTTSSLLTKRRGPEAASTLTLKNEKNEEDQKRQMAKWRVLKREEIELAKKEGWRPMVGRGGVAGNVTGNGGNGGGNAYLSPRDGSWEFERTELPTTPGWVPKLTPTRRGDELFLSVQ
ncbi:hypothetical protein VTL71DRAFT_12443 [Oculimacula yallundae]|uniref:Extracellular membrane protein CFEM domain-containing protein n=1 Tax=Oculimacula yallundae TaxID=86028 RepID=A0ABR4CMK7_9HELO